ncbi:MAG: cupin domain-containing protein [Chloroflexota bacterium]
MPIIHHNKQASKKGYFSKVISRDIINASTGASAFTVWEQDIPVGGYIATHYHDVEEAIMITSGKLQLKLGEEEHTVPENATIFISPHQVHSAKNLTESPVRLIAILESANPKVLYPDEKPAPVRWGEDFINGVKDES